MIKNTISKEELEKYYIKENHTVVQTAEYFGVSSDNIMYLCSKYSLSKRGPKLSEIEEVLDMKEFENYYRSHNQRDTANFFGITVDRVLQLVKKYNLHKTAEEKRNVVIDTWNRNYGSIQDLVSQRQLKTIETLKSKYGEEVDTIWKVPGALEKREKTIVEKYGSLEAYHKILGQKFVDYAIKTYGVENVMEVEEIRQKIREVCIEKYGTEFPMTLKEIQQKAVHTNRVRYKHDYHMQTDEYKQFLSDTSVDRVRKCIETMKRNGSYRTSKVEEKMYSSLCNKYGSEDVLRQYVEERYPWKCDFYISSIDLFIELNAHWTHNDHPFDNNSEDDRKILEKWICNSETSQYWETAVNVWSKYDFDKIARANQNKLNYDIYYILNKNEFKCYSYRHGKLAECKVIERNTF